MITITAGKKYKLKKDFYVEVAPLKYSARKGEVLTANYPSLGYAHLVGENRPEVFGYQVIANENDEVLGEVSRLLIGATELSLHDIVIKIHDLDGICIASHVDRPAFGIINQLGFIPPDLLIDGVEVSFRVPLGEARKKFPGMMNLPCISSSDSHFPDDIGKTKTVFVLAEPTLEEIARETNTSLESIEKVMQSFKDPISLDSFYEERGESIMISVHPIIKNNEPVNNIGNAILKSFLDFIVLLHELKFKLVFFSNKMILIIDITKALIT